MMGDTRRDRADLRRHRVADDVDQLDITDLVGETEPGLTKRQPFRRAVPKVLYVVTACVLVPALFTVLVIQGLTSATTTVFRGPACTGKEASLLQIEGKTGVDFPDGTTVECSVRRVSFMADKFLEFEVRIPAGSPAPAGPRNMTGETLLWQDEVNPETGLPPGAEAFVDRELTNVRWAGSWVIGVDENGETIISGDAFIAG